MAASKGAVSTLTYAEFERCAREIVACSDRLRAGWELRSIRPTADPAKTVFLVKKSTLVTSLVTQSENRDHVEPFLCGPEDNVEDCSDPATLHVQSTDDGQLALVSVHLEHHVVYSTSYEVPVLYFTATFQSGKQLPLKDTWSLISDTYVSAESDRWGLITQHEHPLLSRPFYHIHPCHTAQVMAAVLSCAVDHEQGTGDHEQRTALSCAGDHEQGTALNCAGDHEQGTALNCAGDHEQRTTLKCAGDHERGTAAALNRDDFTIRVVSSPMNKPDNFTSNVNYLLTWLSTFGPLVGMKIPSSFSEICRKKL